MLRISSTGFEMARKGKREPAGTSYIFETHKPGLRYKRFSLFILNSIPPLMKMVVLINLTYCYSNKFCGTLECQLQGKMTKTAMYIKSGVWNSKMQPAAHSCRPFPLSSSSAARKYVPFTG